MRKWFYTSLMGFVLVLAPWAAALATDLMCTYQDALMSDPTFKAAQATYLADQENVPIARAALLPNLVLTGQTQRQYIYQTDAAFFGTPDTTFYNTSDIYALDITQPIFNYAAWSNLQGAGFQAKQAEATFAAAAQDLMIRTAQAYFNVLQNSDTLRYTRMRKVAVGRQLQQASQQYQVGLIARTGVSEAQANYDAIVADEIAAKDNLAVAVEELRAITGKRYANLMGPNFNFPLVQPRPTNILSWVRVSQNQNYTLRAAIENDNAAQENIKTQFGGHLPVINAIGSYNYNHNTSPQETGFSTQEITAAGVSLNFPLYQGGLVNAQTRQARYLYQQAVANMELTHRNVVTQARDAYLGVITGISKVRADRQAIISAQIALEATTEGYKAGTRTILDVLNSQTSLYQAQQTYSADQYNYLINILTLKEAAGTLGPDDLAEMNCWLGLRVEIASKIANLDVLPSAPQRKKVPKIKSRIKKHVILEKPAKSNFALTSANLRHRNDNHYTIELFDTKSQQHALDFIKRYNLQDKGFYYHVKTKEGIRYRVVYGDYATTKQAQVAIQQFPHSLGKLHPWIRSWKKIKEEFGIL